MLCVHRLYFNSISIFFSGRKITSKGQKDLDQIAGQVSMCVCVGVNDQLANDDPNHANAEPLLAQKKTPSSSEAKNNLCLLCGLIFLWLSILIALFHPGHGRKAEEIELIYRVFCAYPLLLS